MTDDWPEKLRPHQARGVGLTPVERRTLAEHLPRDGNAAPVRRVYIPKPGIRAQRPWGLPPRVERAMHGVVTPALAPAGEARFVPQRARRRGA